MSENFRNMTALNWQALVTETQRRRKAEKMTQRQHAALAGVSIPTIVAFDRGERTLSLAKAFDILRVVGLVDEPTAYSAHGVFVQQAFARWQSLIDKLPESSPGRFPNGWYRIDYALEGDLKTIGLHELQSILAKAELKLTGWPMFMVMGKQDFAPREVDGVLECWVGPADGGRVTRGLADDPAHCDFWRAAPEGRMLLMRGYQEDGQETFTPGKIFDTTLPIWRLGEALLHAERLATLLKRDKAAEITVRMRAVYTGLSGRVLKAWANPLSDILIEGGAARSNEAVLEVVVPAAGISERLTAHIFPLVSSLYERFGVTGLSQVRVQAEVDRLQKGRSS